MISLSDFVFRDAAEKEHFEDRLAEIIADDRLDDEEALRSAWASVELRRMLNDRD